MTIHYVTLLSTYEKRLAESCSHTRELRGTDFILPCALHFLSLQTCRLRFLHLFISKAFRIHVCALYSVTEVYFDIKQFPVMISMNLRIRAQKHGMAP